MADEGEWFLGTIASVAQTGARFIDPREWPGAVAEFNTGWRSGAPLSPPPQFIEHVVTADPSPLVDLASRERDADVRATYSVLHEHPRTRRWMKRERSWEALRELQALGHTLALAVDPHHLLRRHEDLSAGISHELTRFREAGLPIVGARLLQPDAPSAARTGPPELEYWLDEVDPMFEVMIGVNSLSIESLDPPYRLLHRTGPHSHESPSRVAILDSAGRVSARWSVDIAANRPAPRRKAARDTATPSSPPARDRKVVSRPDTALTPYPELIAAQDDLVAYWRLGDRSERVKELRGRFHGRATRVTRRPRGALQADDDGAAGFDGRGSVIEVGTAAEFAFAGRTPFSIELWVHIDRPVDTNVRLLSRRRDDERGTSGYELVVNTSLRLAFNRHRGHSVDHLILPRSLSPGVWHHVVVSCDGERSRLTLDGDSAGELPVSVELADDSIALELGRRTGTGGTSTLPGALDEVSITARALDPDEIARRAAYGRPRDEDAAGASAEADWAERLIRLMDGPLWERANAALLLRHLTLALELAYVRGVDSCISTFRAQITAFDDYASQSTGGTLAPEKLSPQFVVFVARFLALSTIHGSKVGAPARTAGLMATWVSTRWQEVGPILAAKLDAYAEESLESAEIEPDELQLLAVAADLVTSGLVHDQAQAAGLSEVAELALRVIFSRSDWSDDGKWAFRSNGRATAPAGHAALLAALLSSLREGHCASGPRTLLLDNLRRGLARHFVEDIVDAAEGPAEVILDGGWIRLPGPRVRTIYERLGSALPKKLQFDGGSGELVVRMTAGSWSDVQPADDAVG